ncbi:hypothetical protein GOODEAATRI_003202 [Goodea atripinnis]|uniref:Secreted protein n=1 Tax=Goodea atripinnis TaxID=208336 RepID=A0ABV0N1F7_9TELE
MVNKILILCVVLSIYFYFKKILFVCKNLPLINVKILQTTLAPFLSCGLGLNKIIQWATHDLTFCIVALVVCSQSFVWLECDPPHSADTFFSRIALYLAPSTLTFFTVPAEENVCLQHAL